MEITASVAGIKIGQGEKGSTIEIVNDNVIIYED